MLCRGCGADWCGVYSAVFDRCADSGDGDITWLIFLLVYGVDGCLTIGHRIMLHENLGEAVYEEVLSSARGVFEESERGDKW